MTFAKCQAQAQIRKSTAEESAEFCVFFFGRRRILFDEQIKEELTEEELPEEE
jgi:hypothetical protein